ncbi:MAG TPA: lysophospholipid acyltransferase family protein [Kofleriaceae bacterium]|nr:lysophospholipid acyltransferase family protein [Kofleriaceae bacterium]
MRRETYPTEPFHDAGHGYDLFGLEPAAVARAVAVGAPLYERYFRVASTGIEHVPRQGAAILIANHSGMLPIDGWMLWHDVVRRTGRVLRPIADHFVPALPFASTRMARVGVVGGARANVRRLLDDGAVIAIFPEGVAGVAKPFRARYRLQAWRVGHAELALRHRAPIIPVAIVGAEESWPVAARLPIRAFGAPYLPVPWSPLPLPVRYHLRYGAPIELARDYPAEAADDPAIVAQAAAKTRAALEVLLCDALRARREGRS